MPGLITDEILAELRALRREVRDVAETQQDIKTKLDALNAKVTALEAYQDLTALGTRIDGITARVDALMPAPAPSTTPPAAEPTSAIDPNTGQPVQPV